MIYKDTARGFISFGGNVVGVFYSFIGFGDFKLFFLSCIWEKKRQGFHAGSWRSSAGFWGVFQLWEGAKLRKMLNCNAINGLKQGNNTSCPCRRQKETWEDKTSSDWDWGREKPLAPPRELLKSVCARQRGKGPSPPSAGCHGGVKVTKITSPSHGVCVCLRFTLLEWN